VLLSIWKSWCSMWDVTCLFTNQSLILMVSWHTKTPLDLKSLKVVLRVKPEADGDGVLLYSSQTENVRANKGG